MDRLIAVLRWLGWHTVAAFTLSWVALAAVLAQIAQNIAGLDIGLLVGVLTLALLGGWLAARTRLTWPRAMALSAILGAVTVATLVGGLGGRLVSLALALGELSWPVTALRGLEHTGQAAGALAAAFVVLASRLWQWSAGRLGGQPVVDPVALMLAWAVTFWGVGAWAAWHIRRRNRVAHALAPTVAVLVVNLFVLRVDPSALLLVLLCGLLLQPLVSHHAHEVRWATTGVDYSEDVRFDIAIYASSLAMGLVLFTAVASSLSLEAMIAGVQNAFAASGKFAISVSGPSNAPLAPLPPDRFAHVRSPGLPRQHLIGSGPELAKQVVMTVTLGSEPPAGVPRLYWHSLVYDRYTGHGWVASQTDPFTLPAGASLVVDPGDDQFALNQSVRVVPGTQAPATTGDLLFNAGQLASANRDLQVARWPDGDVFGAIIDAGDYQVQSFELIASESMLRASGNGVPDAVTARYLALPDDLPARVTALARELTASEPTPYDRALAIEQYLRGYDYTLALPAPPPSRDVVDYFLFDLKKGYCDYYATAMVVLARAAGLPARLVVGYAAGSHVPGTAQYIVTQADAHSWAEVYFAGIGWIEFEPTAGQPLLERPAASTDMPPAEPRPLPRRLIILSLPEFAVAMAALLGMLAGVLVLGINGRTMVDGWRLERMPPKAATALVFARLQAGMQVFGLGANVSQTPYEWLRTLIEKLAGMEPVVSRETATALSTEAAALAALHVAAAFSRHTPGERERRAALAAWRHARRLLWRVRWGLCVRRLRRRHTETRKPLT
jgi:transglutaminase-like putative cysteine protease